MSTWTSVLNVTDRGHVEAVNGTNEVCQGPRRGAWVTANWAWQ
ncbi:hypothetical protein [Aquabacterium sp.]|nr:hypothetical protein [Aquabacterium sp.]